MIQPINPLISLLPLIVFCGTLLALSAALYLLAGLPGLLSTRRRMAAARNAQMLFVAGLVALGMILAVDAWRGP